MVKAWHFVGKTLRDGTKIPEDGEWFEYEGPVKICRSGLHASERLIDALNYAPDFTLCRVECDDIKERHDDKFVCSRRCVIWRIDARDIILEWARRVASDVLHLWNAPEVVKQFLKDGNSAARAVRAAAYAADAAYAARAVRDAADAAYAAYAACAADAVRADADAADAARAVRAAADAAYAACAAYAARAVRADADAVRAAAIEKYNAWLVEMIEAARGEPC